MGTNVPEKKYGRHIVQLSGDISLCAGCSGCEIVCGLVHDGVSGLSVRRIFVEKDDTQLIHKVYACLHCADRPCFEACPRKGTAMCEDEEKAVVYINAEECTGCGLCVKACPQIPKRIQLTKPKKGVAVKCDLCRTRPAGPACIEDCQVMCIRMSDDPLPES
ncbi:MAG: 4Fe-4S dicluster domain-containing protein [Oscillospiraceae bacterium]|nr:4Fe-4S dicluster domain-containing protein [Oscillospiraceae bacterium]